MNFATFTFWWFLIVVGVPIIAIKFVMLKINLWRDQYDRFALLIFSLLLLCLTTSYGFAVFLFDVSINFLLIRIMQRYEKNKKPIAIGIVTFNILFLIYFKYILFFNDVIWSVINNHTVVFANSNALPVGISFYTFQIIAIMADIYKSKQLDKVNLIDYFNSLVFFPKLAAGPIEKWPEISSQLKNFRLKFSQENIDNGMRWLALGCFMKFVLADNLSAYINTNEVKNVWVVLSSTYLFGFKLYFDFAGYSFIAVGLGKILNINLTINFLSPYLVSNIQEFWRRWHVTLMNWFRDYIYIPLGGSKTKYVLLNILLIFLISGAWHGVGWNYLIWGLYHGLMMLLYLYLRKKITLLKPAGWFITFNVVMFGWLFFMTPNISNIFSKLFIIFNPCSYSLPLISVAIEKYSLAELLVLVVIITMIIAVMLMEYLSAINRRKIFYGKLINGNIPYVLMFLSFLLPARSFTRFVYFNF